MAEEIKIVLSGDAESLIKALQAGGTELERFSKQSTKGKESSSSFKGELMSLAGELLPAFGLGIVVKQLGDFVVSANQAADASRVARSSFDNLSGGSQQAADNMAAITAATTVAGRTLVDETTRMQIANQLLGMGIVSNAAEMEKVVGVSRRLGSAFRGMGAAEAANEFAIMISNMSVARLDSFGISSGNVRTRIDELMASTAGMTREQAFFQATMEEADKTMARLGPETETQGQAVEATKAAWADFTAAFGTAMQAAGDSSGVFDAATAAINKLADGARAWVGVFDNMATIEAHRKNVIETTAANLKASDSQDKWREAIRYSTNDIESFKAGLLSSSTSQEDYESKLGQLSDTVASFGNEALNRQLKPALQATGDEFEKSKLAADGATKKLDEQKRAADALAVAQQKLGAAIKAAASYYTDIRKAQDDATQSEADYVAQQADIDLDAREQVAKERKAAAEKIAELQKQKTGKIDDAVKSGKTGEIAQIEQEYNEKIAIVREKEREQTEIIKQEQQKRREEAEIARAQELADQQKHLTDLKLKTSLSLLETSGQLGELTGIAGAKATDVQDLIEAGLLPVTESLASAIGDVQQGLLNNQAAADDTARSNEAIITRTLNGPQVPDKATGADVTPTADLSQTNTLLSQAITTFGNAPSPVVNITAQVTIGSEQVAAVVTPIVSGNIARDARTTQRAGGIQP